MLLFALFLAPLGAVLVLSIGVTVGFLGLVAWKRRKEQR